MKLSRLIPVAMASLLLIVPPAFSAPPDKGNNGHGKPDKEAGKSDKDEYKQSAKSNGRKEERYAAGGPPPWAPAHGYRRGGSGAAAPSGSNGGSVTVQNDEVRIATEVGISKGTCNRDAIGAVLGGVVGGVIGNQTASKENRDIATLAGVVIGGIVGHTIGSRMDKRDVQCTGQVLERAADRKTVTWRNPESGQNYEITPLSTFSQEGQFCREYLARALDGSARKESTQSACRNPDGTWRMVQ